LATKARNYRDELFTALVLSGRSTEALELVDLMLTTERRVSALCRVAQALTHESSRYAVAPILFRAEQIAEGIRDIWSYSRAFNLLLQAVLAGRDWDEAIRIAYRFGDARERIEALGTVVLAMAAAGESVRMHEVIVRCLDLAKRIGYRVALDQPFRMAIGADMSTSPTAVLSGPTPTGATNESLAMAFSVLVSIGRGDVDKAGSVSHRIHNPALEVMTLVELARYWAATGSETAAKPLLESLPAILERISDPISKTDCLIAISLLLAQIGDRSRAIELLSAASNASSNSGHMTVLDDLPSRVSAVAGLAEDVWALGNPGTAVTILEQAIQMTRGGPNREHRQTCLRNIADIASTMGRDELAGELLVEAGGAPLALFEDIDAVLEMLNRAGDVKGAVDLLVSDRYLDNLIKKKAWDDAIDFARSETSKKAPYDATLNEKTWPHTRSVPETAAATELKQQLYLQKRATRSLTVVRGLIRAGERSRAHALVSETLPLLPQIAEASVRATTMAASAEAVAQLGDVSVTVNLIHETLDLSHVLAIGDQLDVLNVLVLAAQQVGQVGVAISIIERLTMIVSAAPDSASKARALRYVVRALARVKSSARLQEIIQTEWMQLETRDELIALLPLASPLVVDGSVGAYLTSSFEWVDEFVSIT
jgi:tetratricopeptide (TPR) repeat protein